MKGYKQDQFGVFHPCELPDYPATHASGAPSRVATKPAAKPKSALKPATKANRPTGRATIAGVGHRKMKSGFKAVKSKTSHPTTARKSHAPLHKAATQAKHGAAPGAARTGTAPTHTPQRTAKGPSLGGGPCSGYQDASGNPLDSVSWAPGVPYENAVFADLDGSQWLGQISIYDGSFTTLERMYNPSQASGPFNNPVAHLTNGHVYSFSPLHSTSVVPTNGYYSELIKIQHDLGPFANGLPAGASAVPAGGDAYSTNLVIQAIQNGATVSQSGGNIQVSGYVNSSDPSVTQWTINSSNGGGRAIGPSTHNKLVHHPSGWYQVSLILQAIANQGQNLATDGGMPLDGGALDAGALDAGALDAGALDGGALDGGALDGGALSALGSVMASPSDGGALDGGGLPVMPSAPTPSGVAAPANVSTPSGVAAPAGGVNSSLQALIQAAQSSTQALVGQVSGTGADDAGATDAGSSDAGSSDAGSSDAGATDAGAGTGS